MNIARSRRTVVLCAVLANLPLMACESVPLLAPTGSTITLTALATALPVNGSTQIIAQVIEAAGTPPHSGTHVIFTTSLGRVVPSEAETDVNGRVVVVFEAGSANGTATISASSGAATGVQGGTSTGGTTGGSNSTTTTTTPTNVVKIAIGTAAVGRVVVSANPAVIPAIGGTSLISALVSDINGNALPSASVAFSTDAGTILPAVGVTDANGVATSTLTTSTTAKVTATVGQQSTSGTGGSTTATPSPVGQTSGTVQVNVSTAPTLVIEVQTTTGAPSAGLPTNVKFTVSTSPQQGAITAQVRDLTVNWGDGSSQSLGAVASTATASHVYRSAGTYTISAVLTDTLGNQVRQATSVTVVPVQRPAVQVTQQPNPGKVGTVTTLIIQVTVPTGIGVQDVSIDFGDGQRANLGGATSAQVPHIYSAIGTYTVTVTVTDTAGQTTIGTAVISIGT